MSYQIAIDPTRARLTAHTCVPSPARERSFSAADEGSSRYLLSSSRSSGAPIEQMHGDIVARDWKAAECLDYEVDLAQIAGTDELQGGMKVDQDLLSSAATWLYRPRGLEAAKDAEISIDLPSDWSLSTPWKALDDSSPRRFSVGVTPASWPAMVAVTRSSQQRLVAGNGSLRIAMLGKLSAREIDKLREFVTTSAQDVAAAFPHAFRDEPQLVLIARRGAGDAVDDGMSVRGGGAGVLVVVDPTRPRADFARDWVLRHEFVHGLHPHLAASGRWISEGLATYYQNVLRARGGRLTAQEAWDELDAGFERGRADKADSSLAQISENLECGGVHVMRGYWAGAALMLRADVALRTRRNQPSSLDAAINGFLACCRNQKNEWRAADFLSALDRIVGGDVFSRLYRDGAGRAEFPELGQAYRQLGLTHQGGHVDRAVNPEASALRVAIMGSD